MPFTYIIRCSDDTLYTGIAKDLEKRILTHLSGKGACAKYTKSHKLQKIETAWECDDYKACAKLEYAVKKLARKDKLSLIQNPESVNGLFDNLADFTFFVADKTLVDTINKTIQNSDKFQHL